MPIEACKMPANRLERFVKLATQGIWTVDANNLTNFVNDYGASILGYKPEEMLGRPVTDFIYPESKEVAEGQLKDRKEGRGQQDQFRLCHKDGHEVWISFNASSMYDEQGRYEGAISIFSDVTEHRRMGTALMESQQDLNLAQSVSKTGSWRIKVSTNELVWSDETYSIFGIPVGTPMTYELFLSRVHPDDRGYVDHRWQAALKGEPYDIEHRIVVDGEVRWVREKAILEFEGNELQGGFGTVQDITERMKMEEESARLASFPQLNPSPIVEVNQEGQIVYVNPAARSLFPDLEERGLSHPFLVNSEHIIDDLRSGKLSTFSREVQVGMSWFQQQFNMVPEAKSIRIYSLGIDARKRAEDALKESQRNEQARRQELEALMNAVPATIWISRNPEGTDMVGNKATDELLGVPSGANVSETAPPEQRLQHFLAYRDGKVVAPNDLPMQEAGRTGKAVQGSEFELRFEDGRSVWLYGNAVPLLNEDGRIRGVVGAFVDITDRKKAEEAVKESEAKYHGLFENLQEAVSMFTYVFDEDGVVVDWRYVNANQAVLKALGMSLADIKGRTVMQLFGNEAMARYVPVVREMRRTNVPTTHEGRFDPLGGYALNLFVPLCGEEFIVSSMDVTGIRKAQRKAEEASAFMENIVANSPEGIAVFDGHNLTVKVMNEYYRQNFLDEQYKHMDLVGKRIEEFIPDAGTTPVPALLLEVARTGKPFIANEYEFRGFRRGTTYWNLAYVPIGSDGSRDVLVTAIEVTHQVEARRKVEEERARLQLILNSLPVGVSVADANGRVLIRNQIMNDFLGDVPPAEGISGYARILGYHPGTEVPLAPEEWPIARSLLKGEVVSNEELDVQRTDCTRATLLTSSMPIRNEYGEIIGGLAVFTDITNQKQLEERLKRSNAELQQFAYVASHDLQEPLRMVTVYLQLLNKKFGNELSPQAKKYMSTAVSGSERMRQLIDDLLQYSRVDAYGNEHTLVDLTAVAEKVKEDLHIAINEAKAQVTIEPLPTILADEAQMAQVLHNLLSNAVKFHGEEPPRIVVFAHNGYHEWIIAVRDNGIGIDPKYKDNLFKMFQRLHTQEEYPGTGIGLAISKKIVERHGGRIWFESEPGKGSTFYFTIPMR